MRSAILAALAAMIGLAPAAAQEMQNPRLSVTNPDWSAVRAVLEADAAVRPADPSADAIEALNGATAALFADIAKSPVPVLLPFDVAGYLRDRASESGANATSTYQGGFEASFFQAGPMGYDAVFTAKASEISGVSGISYARPINVFISGSAKLYELDEPAGLYEMPTKDIEEDVPGVRRVFLENYVRYAFERFGVPYVLAIQCFNGGARYRMMSCRDAHRVAVRVLKLLRVAGGTPQRRDQSPPDTIARPDAVSSVFTYHSPGAILPGTGMRGRGGRVDYTVYSKMRFPFADAPAYANSQSFMHWGDCDHTGRAFMGRRDGLPLYRCRRSGKSLVADESHYENYSYPWRDNFCEHRSFWVGTCPGGLGHQGQDLRPADCRTRGNHTNRCQPYHHDVVSVRDGAVLRTPGQHALFIVVNAPNERVRFRYLHMFPGHLDAAGLFSNRRLREGEIIGKVGNFVRKERGTTYHLHFDMQVPTKYGWVFVNPYMTLVAAYERLIRGRGTEIKDEPVTSAAHPEAATVTPASAVPLPEPRAPSEGDDTGEGE